MLAHSEEFYYQNPESLGESLFIWVPAVAPSMNASAVQGKKKKPDVSGQDTATYWYKSHFNYDYSKDPDILHAHAGNNDNNSIVTILQDERHGYDHIHFSIFRFIHSNDLAINSKIWLWQG